MPPPVRYFVRCAADDFIDWAHPYEQFAQALLAAQHLDSIHRACGPHSVRPFDWTPNASDSRGE